MWVERQFPAISWVFFLTITFIVSNLPYFSNPPQHLIFFFPLIIIEFHQPSPLKAAFLLHFCVFHAVTRRVFAQLLLKRSRNLQGYKFELVNRLWTFSFCNQIDYIITRVYCQQTSVQRYSIEFLVVLHLLHKICLN